MNGINWTTRTGSQKIKRKIYIIIFFLEKTIFSYEATIVDVVEFIYATCSWPLAGSAAFITSGRSGGEEYGVKSNSSNSPESNLRKLKKSENVSK